MPASRLRLHVLMALGAACTTTTTPATTETGDSGTATTYGVVPCTVDHPSSVLDGAEEPVDGVRYTLCLNSVDDAACQEILEDLSPDGGTAPDVVQGAMRRVAPPTEGIDWAADDACGPVADPDRPDACCLGVTAIAAGSVGRPFHGRTAPAAHRRGWT